MGNAAGVGLEAFAYRAAGDVNLDVAAGAIEQPFNVLPTGRDE